MVYTGKISDKTRALVVYYRRESGASYREIARKCRISASSAVRICREDKQQSNLTALECKRGRPRKVDERSVRKLIRCLKNSRKTNPNVTVKTLVSQCGLTLDMASRRTYSRRLNEKGYGFYQTRKKGLVSERDKILRMKYARKMKRCMLRNENFWKNEVAFYLDGVSFIFKHNPLNGAIALKARVWRKRSEGLIVTGRGSKELAGGKRLHVMWPLLTEKVWSSRFHIKKWMAHFLNSSLDNILTFVLRGVDLKKTVVACSSWITIHHKQVKLREKRWRTLTLSFTKYLLDRQTLIQLRMYFTW